MIELILDKATSPYEQDIRELVQEFYPGEVFQIRDPDGIHLTHVTQEEKNALKRAKESGRTAAVNRKSTKNRDRMAEALTPDGVRDADIDLSMKITARGLKLTGDRRTDKSLIKAKLYRKLTKQTGITLPWGDMTGIRPVSLVSPEISRALRTEALDKARRSRGQEEEYGRIQDPLKAIRKKMTEEYCIRGEKLSLMMDIGVREQKLLSEIETRTGFSYQEGWSLYIGIPFCPTRCLYCSFLSNTIDRWQDRLSLYFDALKKELQSAVQEMTVKRGMPLETIYIGGGTPTALDAYWLDRLMKLVRSQCDVRSLVEFTVEAGRPDSITREKLRILKAAGVTRISVNPQTFNQKTLDLIGRRHSVEAVREAYRMAREEGFDNINMDIILGLPGERLPEVTNTLCEIARLRPDSLTVHALAVKRAARLTLERDHWAGIYRAGDEKEILRESHDDRKGYTEINRMMLASAYTAELLGLEPYYLYRQKNMAGNLENTGYASDGKACLYNILMMEEKHTVIGCGAGTSTKAVLPDRGGDPDKKRVERADNGKDIGFYLEHVDELILKKNKILQF